MLPDVLASSGEIHPQRAPFIQNYKGSWGDALRDVDTYRRGAKVARILLLQLLARWKMDLARSGQGLF